MELSFDRDCSYVIAHINKDFIFKVEKDLANFGKKNLPKNPHHLKAFIPTVKILRKQFKGRDIFENVPLLFNYGFFQVPNQYLVMDFLLRLKSDVPAIHSWIRSDRHESTSIAIARKKELQGLREAFLKYSIYDRHDVDLLLPGTTINLKGYPFDGMDAKVVKVDKKKEKIKVELLLGGLIKTTEVSFDNAIYTIYHSRSLEDGVKEEYIEELGIRVKAKASRNFNND